MSTKAIAIPRKLLSECVEAILATVDGKYPEAVVYAACECILDTARERGEFLQALNTAEERLRAGGHL